MSEHDMVNVNTTVYRSPAIIVKEKETFGLIRTTRHKCNLPGLLKRFWLAITFRGIPVDSVYRCSCKIVWELEKRGSDMFFAEWHATSSARWKAVGGRINENGDEDE